MDISNLKKMLGMYKKQKDKQKDDLEKMFQKQLEINNKAIEDMIKIQLANHKKEMALLYEKELELMYEKEGETKT